MFLSNDVFNKTGPAVAGPVSIADGDTDGHDAGSLQRHRARRWWATTNPRALGMRAADPGVPVSGGVR